MRILMLGDSLVEWGDWRRLLPEHTVDNRGIAGETTEGLAGRLGREVEHTEEPELVLLMSGTNNLLMGDLHFPALFETMLPRLALLCPGAAIIVNGLAPMPIGLDEQVQTVNRALAQCAGRNERCRFLDMKQPFSSHCPPDGRACFSFDRVHFSDAGYAAWAAAIGLTLAQPGPGPVDRTGADHYM